MATTHQGMAATVRPVHGACLEAAPSRLLSQRLPTVYTPTFLRLLRQADWFSYVILHMMHTCGMYKVEPRKSTA